MFYILYITNINKDLSSTCFWFYLLIGIVFFSEQGMMARKIVLQSEKNYFFFYSI